MGKCRQGKPSPTIKGLKICKINEIACELSEREDSDECPVFTDYHERMEGKK